MERLFIEEVVVVLVHPWLDEEVVGREKAKAWEKLIKRGCRRIPDDVGDNERNGLGDVSYVNELPEGSRVRLGGMRGEACVLVHALELAQCGLVQRGKVQVAVDRNLTWGREGWEEVVEEVYKSVEEQLGVRIEIV